MADQLTDEELTALEQGEPDSPEEVEAAEPETPEPEDEEPEPEPEPVRAQPQTVPLDRLNEIAAERDRYRDLLAQLTQQVQQPQQAQQNPAVSYVRPDEPDDRKVWRGFVGETVDGVLNQKIAAVLGASAQHKLALNERIQDLQMRTEIDPNTGRLKYPDYQDLLPDITAFRQNLVRQFGAGAAEAPLEYAYHIVKGQKGMRPGSTQQRRAVVKRATAAATGEGAPPAKARKAGQSGIKRVEDMSLKEMEAHLIKENARF